ncbi:putative cytochrome P450 oxidoreductase OrdA-like protein [Talaromyces proteolyticus]|uniref:Cytochrome P450 oxidoreductase OrdA-like protein n=1 Tax=Talaromyces proteolyticus TaxID=1131652 RepID=A0AAD4KNI5_9EURO|nr:putative cytochrome P450 oxidoreductase OrdA-like protein [Talaromyces proteolyticus]KAH8696732.1 putative cytochrome P450 oxidoreductase OrdA-like protein [Talaromyces proteolyticus]
MAWIPFMSVLLAVTGFYLVYKIIFHFKSAKRLPLPPGPKPNLLLGNLNDLPKPGEQEWLHWLKHKDLYGGISSITVMGQPLVILHDVRLAFELLEKRSAKHSSRPKQTFAGEMCGWENSLGLSPYNSRFRALRKNMTKVLGSQVASTRFNPLQEVEAGHFLLRVLNDPENFTEHIRTEAGSVILKIAYGYSTEPHKPDPLVQLAGRAMDQFGKAGVPGAWLVDVLPFLKHIPEWLPGAAFKKTARNWGDTLTELTERPYAFVKHQMAAGVHEPSFLSHLLQQPITNAEELFTVKCSAMSLFAAGADTTVSSLACFFLAMTKFPEVQRKAQEELDRVVGTTRLPLIGDRANLPYIDAIVKEILRWHPVAPMGLPHMTTEDDVCEGYFIPKGSYIMPNVWFFTHDPSVYKEPMTFKPERFLATDEHPIPEPDPHAVAFGFGRRICPGRLLADTSLYINVAQSLAVFSISKHVNSKGLEVEDIMNFQPGVVSHPSPFKATIKPRSADHEALIRNIEKIHPWPQSDAKVLENVNFR